MGLDLVNIARANVARVGLARLNAGEVEYTADGSATLSGVALVIVDPYVFTMTGGASLSGDTSPSVSMSPVCSGIGIVEGAISVALDVKVITAGGGTATGGAATVLWSANYIAPAITGGLVSGGDAYLLADFIPVPSGSASLSGAAGLAIAFSGAASGGMDFAGAAVVLPEFAFSFTGSASLSGSALVVIDYCDTASGGPVATAGDSDADAEIEYHPPSSGSASTSGLALYTIEIFGAMGGEATLSGTPADLYADYKDVAAFQGGVDITGEAVYIFSIDVKGLPVFIRRLDGDVRLSLSADGGIIKIRGGQPEMDEGLETAVNISLFSEGEYWGNAAAPEAEAVGSGFLASLRVPLSNQARLDVIEAARASLAWLVSSGIATSVEPTATIPSVGRLDLAILIRQPEKAPATFRYTVNWQSQYIAMKEGAA